MHDHTRAVEWIQNHCPSEGEPTLGGLCRDEWGSQPTFAQTSHASRRLPQPAPLYQGFDRDSQHSTRQCEQAPLSSITWHDDQQANQEADVVDYLSENPEDDWTYPQYQARQSSVPMSDQGYPSRQRDATRSKSPDRISVASSSRKRNHVGQLSEQQQAPPLQRPRLDTRYAYAIARVPGPVIPAQRDYDLGLSRIVEAEREDDEHDRSSAEQDLLDFSDPEPQPEPETALTTPDSEGGKEMGMNWHLQQKLQHAKFPVVDVLVNTSCHWRWEDRRQIIQAMHKGLCARLQGREVCIAPQTGNGTTDEYCYRSTHPTLSSPGRRSALKRFGLTLGPRRSCATSAATWADALACAPSTLSWCRKTCLRSLSHSCWPTWTNFLS